MNWQGYTNYKDGTFNINGPDYDSADIKCPYGQPGDILWVRESWCLKTPYGPEDYYFGYKAGDTGVMIKASEKYDYKSPDVYFPSIHMPKEACRIKLLVKSVRVERLQDITEQDAIAEGVSRYPKSPIYGYKNYQDSDGYFLTAKESFKSLWQSINGPDSWDANPWVWVVEFERVQL